MALMPLEVILGIKISVMHAQELVEKHHCCFTFQAQMHRRTHTETLQISKQWTLEEESFLYSEAIANLLYCSLAYFSCWLPGSTEDICLISCKKPPTNQRTKKPTNQKKPSLKLWTSDYFSKVLYLTHT